MSKLTLTLDSHQLTNAQTCEYLHKYTYIDCIEKKETKAGLAKGTIWHEIIHFYYERIKNRVKKDIAISETTNFILTNKVIERNRRMFENNYDFNERMEVVNKFLAYLNFYSDDYTYDQLVEFEKGFSKVIYEDQNVLFVYEGKIDCVLRIGGHLLWRDYKTQHPRFTADLYQFSNQFLGYTWVLGTHNGIVDYTTWSKETTDRTFRRIPYSYSKAQIEDWKISTIKWYFRILRTQISGKYEKNRASCDRKYGICPYSKLCEATSEREIGNITESDFIQVERWRAW